MDIMTDSAAQSNETVIRVNEITRENKENIKSLSEEATRFKVES